MDISYPRRLFATMKEERRDKKALTPAKIKFCEEYVGNGGNATRAYLAAYPHIKNKASANSNCQRLLKDQSVQDYIWSLQEDLRRHSDVTKQEILHFITSAMRVDIRDFLTVKDGKIQWKDSDEWTNEMAMLVEDVRETKNGISLKLAGKEWSVERICKMLGYDSPEKINLEARNTVTVNLEVSDEMARTIHEIEGV